MLANVNPDINQALESVYRSNWGRIVAILIRLVGDFDVAEEAAQEAFAVAVHQWHASGIPAHPRAWIIQTARYKAIDRLRIESAKEMGASRLHVMRVVMHHYGRELAQLVPFPDGWESLWPTLPATGKPGEPAFDRLPLVHQEQVNRVFSHILKVLAAYE